jgi:hypothetical protein
MYNFRRALREAPLLVHTMGHVRVLISMMQTVAGNVMVAAIEYHNGRTGLDRDEDFAS